MDYYILDDLGRPMEVEDVMIWARWYATAERHVDQTVVGDRLFVSTVFLALDHSWSETSPPILWETMIFKHNGWAPPDFDEYCERYSSREDAAHGHQLAVAVAEAWLAVYDKAHP